MRSMMRHLLAWALCCLFFVAIALGQASPAETKQLPPAASSGTKTNEILTDSSIVSLVKAGLPSDVIVTKINTTGCRFELDVDNLTALKGARVPDDVLRAMIAKDCNESGRENLKTVSTAASPPPLAAGKIKGTLTYFFNRNFGNRPDTGAEVMLLKGTVEIPADRAVVTHDEFIGVGAPPQPGCIGVLIAVQNPSQRLELLKPFGDCLTTSIASIAAGTAKDNQSGARILDVFKRTVTDGDGNFEIDNIPPGEYTLVEKSQHTKDLILRDFLGRLMNLRLTIEAGKSIDASHDFGTSGL